MVLSLFFHSHTLLRGPFGFGASHCVNDAEEEFQPLCSRCQRRSVRKGKWFKRTSRFSQNKSEGTGETSLSNFTPNMWKTHRKIHPFLAVFHYLPWETTAWFEIGRSSGFFRQREWARTEERNVAGGCHLSLQMPSFSFVKTTSK